MKKVIHMITFLLMALGAFNWLLVSVSRYNLVDLVFGAWPQIEQLVYILIGLSGIYEFVTHKQYCTLCSSKK